MFKIGDKVKLNPNSIYAAPLYQDNGSQLPLGEVGVVRYIRDDDDDDLMYDVYWDGNACFNHYGNEDLLPAIEKFEGVLYNSGKGNVLNLELESMGAIEDNLVEFGIHHSHHPQLAILDKNDDESVCITGRDNLLALAAYILDNLPEEEEDK